jgi:ATP-dependent DNA helicase UvrD/PcrA
MLMPVGGRILNVRAAYLHDLKAGERSQVDVSKQCLEKAEAEVIALVDRLKARQFEPRPGPACRTCDVRAIRRFAE